MTSRFGHEKLRVYQDSIKFVVWATDLLEKVPKNLAVWDQLDRAATSTPLNIAQANGKFTGPDRCRFFDTARGSALECSACLDVLLAKRKASENDSQAGKSILQGVVSMLVGLIRSSSPERLHEGETEYRSDAPESVENNSSQVPNPAKIYFDHEKLQVYQESLRLVGRLAEVLEKLPQNLLLWSKLDRGSTAIPLSIAEGNGKFTGPDRCRFFDNARSAAFECGASLDTLVAKRILEETEIITCKTTLCDIVSMLVGLIRSNSQDRFPRQAADYRALRKAGDYD